ncbi:MAG: nitrilase-related carbon-nitrogen hydrolase, partial [Phenylobacterium sp.]|nr:nitrilase-related carbon-nitrogen hydrolase [Phenylobacterium sp.]
MIFLIQEPWRASTATVDVGRIAALTALTEGDSTLRLILLPIAQPEIGVDAPTTLAVLADIARTEGAYLAGAAAFDRGGTQKTEGFLIGPDGVPLLTVGKTLPDLVANYTDSDADLGRARAFPVADTPFGKIGMLVGEDILSPHLARMTAQAGGEVILNPAFERGDVYFEARQAARAARAYENLAMVLCASPARLEHADLGVERLPAAAAAYDTIGLTIVAARGDESMISLDPDIQAVRRRRSETYANFPVVVRTGLYAGGYAQFPAADHAPIQGRDAWRAEGARRIEAQAKPGVEGRLDRYDVVLGQMDLMSVHDLGQRDAVLDHNVERAIALVRGMARSPSVKLVVFPEFFMQGVVTGRPLDYWMQVSVRMDGPEIAKLQAFAKSSSVFVSGMVYEVDPAWPDRYFNTAFIIDDEGRLIHRYRKIHGADTGLLSLTTPGNIYSDYVARDGYDALFPVADTKIGKLGTLVCFDMNFPETARELARRGAEVLIHPTSEPHNARRHGWDIGRRTRAFENLAYVVSCGTGGQYMDPADTAPSPAKRGHSKIVRFDGRLEAAADGPGHLPLMGPI